MTTALVPAAAVGLKPRGGSSPAFPWRDPHTVPSEDLCAYIQHLEAACAANPQSADLRTCLGIAHAVNFDIYKSMDALEAAREVDPVNFWAQLKYGELHYRMRTLQRAEEETKRAVDLATNRVQLAIARRQLKEIRTLRNTSVRDLEWTKPLTVPALCLAAMAALVLLVGVWR
jgi:hypothetical protein